MSGNPFTMETKQEIYASWVQYTTKNEESHFRHFIKGFVAIWESQLKLDWTDNESLPSWSTVKDDFGPHLSRLPEELLPAIGKFIFIAKDNTEKGSLSGESITEVDLLVRCLTAISRNFDNIPLIASCDFVSHAVGIANSIVHQLVNGDCAYAIEGSLFCTNLCHFLECLYDPYLTWRHFQLQPLPPPDKLVFHPALLHNEVIPFIYECFETSIVLELPELSREMLSVLGAVVCGAQSSFTNDSDGCDGKTDNERHNALRGICPATMNLLMGVVSLPQVESAVQITALQCFTAMVTVLHRSLPHERQIEVTTVLEKLREVVSQVVARDWTADCVATLLQLVQTMHSILSTAHSLASLQSLMVEARLVDALINILERSASNNGNKEELEIATVRALNRLVLGASEGKKRMVKICGYSRLFACLQSIKNPRRKMLEVLVSMITEEEDNICLKDMKLINTEPLVPFINWLGELPPDDQLWLACTFEGICTNSLQSKAVACNSGVVVALCELLSSATLDPRAAPHLVLLSEALASYSVTANELKHFFLLLRMDQEKKNSHRTLLLSSISNITRKAGSQLHCDSYFDIEQHTDGITVSDMRKWNGAVYGFSFHCWLRLEPLQLLSPGVTPARRQIFNFVTAQGTGMEGFVSSQGALVVGVTTKKEFLAATVPDLTLLDTQWHCLDLCYMAARRPFGHNQLSVFIDGHQKLVAAMKFPAMTEPFSLCTVGAAAARNYQPNQTRSDRSPSGIMERGILPSIMSQVPNYFSLPLRSSTPLDPHVKNFPPGMQDTIFGTPSSLQGQLGLICLFHEALQQHQVKTLCDSGPNCRLLFSPEDNAEMLVMNSKLVWCFAPAACWDSTCIDLAPTNKFTAKALARQCLTHTIKDVINGIGGVQVLFPLLECIDWQGEEGPDLSLLSPQASSPSHTVTQDMAEWVELPASTLSEKKLEQNAVSSMLLLLRNMLSSSSVNQEQLMKNNGVAILGTLLSKVPSQLMEPSVLKAVQLLSDTVKSSGNVVLLRSIHQHILFNFNIWSKCPFHVRISHIQLMSTIIKDERKVFRKRYGVQYFLDAIRMHHANSTEVSEDEIKTIRVSLLGLIKFYLQKECNIKELAALLGFLSTVKEEILVIEVLEMLIAQLESKSCKDQLILLMFEPQAADLIYCLLLNKSFSMDLKHRALKMLSVLLRTEKVYERNKSRLRLQDSTTVGLYPGLISMLPEQQLSMEFIAMLLDQILLTESSSSYAGALSLLQALALAELDIKLEAARKLLTTTFMRPSAPLSLAKQVGWQDCITRLLVKKPITDVGTEAFPDLMSFDDDEESLDFDPGRVSPSSASRISDAAYAIEFEIKEVAETVTNAVADNIQHAADNITSVVTSAYTAIRQKTVEMQESLEELGARSRLKKRSLTSLTEEPYSLQPSPGLSLTLDPDLSSLTNRSQSSSSTEELSSPSHTAKDSLSLASLPSLSSQPVDDDSDDDEKILFDALQRWRAFDAEKIEDKEEELCYLVTNLVFTIMWRGIDVNSKEAWKERGQVMACINLLALNNMLYCSHLELKLRLLELAVTAALSDLREGSYTADNAAQLIRWIYDLTVIDPKQDHSKKASTKLLDGVLGLLDALLVFQEVPGEEWTEMAKLAFGILLSCAASSNLELCAMATAKLHTLVQTRCMKDAEEGGYLLYYINTIVQQSLQGGNQEHYSFLMPVVKALIEKLPELLSMATHLPDLPQTLSGPTFYEHFQTFCQGEQWATFMNKQVKPLYESYQAALSGHFTDSMNIFWAECYEGSKLCVHKRNREVGESKMRFQSQIVSGYRARQTEETIRYNNLCNQMRNQELLVRRKWRLLRSFFHGPRGAWRSSLLSSLPSRPSPTLE